MDKNNGVSATTIIAMEKTPTMARYLPNSVVTELDISEEALKVAEYAVPPQSSAW